MAKKTLIDAAYQAGMVQAMLRLPYECEFTDKNTDLKDAHRAGFEDYMGKAPLEKGECLYLFHPCGERVKAAYDDLKIGDEVVLVCNLRGILAAGVMTPNIVRTHVSFIDDGSSEVAHIGEDRLIGTKDLVRPYPQRKVLRVEQYVA